MRGIFIKEQIIDLDVNWTKKAILSVIIDNMNIKKRTKLTNVQIGNTVNLERSSISKALKELEDDGLIKIDNSTTKRNYGREISLNMAIEKSSEELQETKGIYNKRNLQIMKTDCDYTKQSHFSLPKEMTWQELPDEYKDKLKDYIDNKIIDIENKLIQNNAEHNMRKILRYESFELSLESKRYPYLNFAAVWMKWHQNGMSK